MKEDCADADGVTAWHLVRVTPLPAPQPGLTMVFVVWMDLYLAHDHAVACLSHMAYHDDGSSGCVLSECTAPQLVP